MTRLPASSAAATPITMCRGCGSRRLTRVLDLGEQPACDHFPPVDDPAPDPLWPLALTMCVDCALVQLDHVSPAPEEPLALESETLKRHARFVAHLKRARSARRRVVAYGAGSKACTLLGVTRVGADLLPMVADLSRAKHGRRVPGVGVPIVSPKELVAAAPDEVMILTWDIAAEVIAQPHAMGLSGARFFVPLPRLAELTPA